MACNRSAVARCRRRAPRSPDSDAYPSTCIVANRLLQSPAVKKALNDLDILGGYDHRRGTRADKA